MKQLGTFVLLAVAAFSNQASANSFTTKFSEYSFSGYAFMVDAATNSYYSANHGVTIENAYLYVDSRDTFDQIGLSTGTGFATGDQTAKVNFLDLTDYVTVDWWTTEPTIYSAFKSDGSLLDSFYVDGDQLGTYTFNSGGSLISYITWTSGDGYGQISTLTYNFDGITDGHNDNLNQSAAPLPTALPLMLSGLGILSFASRRRKNPK